ncbi:MAG TPA: hypothetical protein VNI36_08660 [Candidatus Dormibacteraeota bacterium]|nr:hypothetical protein [Candidatus Dormibacteraeota bacterium]
MTRTRFQFTLLFSLLGVLFFVPAMHSQSDAANPGAATITYRRVFKGSSPEFIEIKIIEPGAATFDIRQLADDADPTPFAVGPAVRRKIVELAADLNNFAITGLNVHKKIANLGQKTFRYERGAEVHEVSFNYTLNAPASQLMQIFEGLAQQQGDLVQLERSAKYDRLGVNDALREFESDLDRRLLPEPERLLPVLDQIAADSRFVDIARDRARALAGRIRASRDH